MCWLNSNKSINYKIQISVFKSIIKKALINETCHKFSRAISHKNTISQLRRNTNQVKLKTCKLKIGVRQKKKEVNKKERIFY